VTTASRPAGVEVSDVARRLAVMLDTADGDAKAVWFEGDWWTWSDLASAARSLGETLADLGLGPGARVGIVLENRPAALAALVAVVASGRCVTTLSPMQPPERLAGDIERSELPLVVASSEVLDRPGIRAAVASHGRAVVMTPDGTFSLEPSRSGPRAAAREYDPATAVEMWTSGTTGPPKRVPLDHATIDTGMVTGGVRSRDVDGRPLVGGSVGIMHSPLVHISGMWGSLSSLYAGRRIALLERFSVDRWLEAVELFRPAASGLVPAALRAVIEADVDPARLSSLQAVVSGTAPCPVELAQAFKDKYGIPVLMTYGATEFGGAVAGWTLPLHLEWWDRKKGSAGRVFPSVAIRVVDEEGRVLAPGDDGRVEVSLAPGDDGEPSWRRTSDLGRLDEDDFLWITGRADDAIIRGGFKVHPGAVRAVLERHPAVREAAVAGLPDDRLGSVPVAAVEVEPGAVPPSPDELLALAREHLTPYEVPTRVLVVAALPRTPAMKVSRVDLLELFADETR
jgi:acyl-coenzyme A synthetase/AMP-(fatty) acid ligase